LNKRLRAFFLRGVLRFWEYLKELIILFMGIINYLRDTKAELRHVTWPTKQETINYTIVVLLISIGTGVFLGILDFVFRAALNRFI